MKEKPKAKQTGKPKAKRAETTRGAQTAQGANPSARDTANPSAANGAAQGAAAGGCAANLYKYNREQVRRFISELPKDCALICDTVKQSLFDDGAGLLEDETLCKPLGRIAYIDDFIRYFGAYFEIEDTLKIMEEMAYHDKALQGLKTVCVEDLTRLASLPNLDKDLLRDILKSGDDDKTCFCNLSLYFFSLWVNFHVGAVVLMFQKWVEVYGDNVPPLLRDMSMLARCVCIYTRTEDNTHGGIYYNGSWFESFAMCGARRRKRNAEAARERDAAAARDLARTVAEPVARPNPSAAQGANPSARDTAKPSEPVGNGAAVFNITAAAVNVQAATVEMPEPKKQNAGHCGGMSQAEFAALLIHCGDKNHGERYTERTVKRWERKGANPPTAGGVKYCAELRRDILKARIWANDFNTENANAHKARTARV